jgi:hypothetical protein
VLIFRRWKIALPLLLLSIGATVFVALTAKPDYAMTSYVQLIPAKVAPSDNPTSASLRNPWNQLGLNTLGQASIYATQDQGFLQQLKATKHTDNFTLTMTYPDPIVTVEVVGTTPADARDTTDLIINRLRGAAESLQRGAGVGDTDIIATQRLDRGQNLLPSRSKQKRAILAVAAAGVIMTAGGTVGLDAIMRYRRRKRLEAEGGAADETPETTTPAPAVNGNVSNAASNAVPGAVSNSAVGLNGNGKAVVNGTGGMGHVPVLRGDPGFGGADRGAPPDSVERTAIIIKRSSSVVKAAPPKQQRRSPAATYRSANARSVNGDGGEDDRQEHESAPAETNGDTSADSSDVRAVLQTKWVGAEDGGKPE